MCRRLGLAVATAESIFGTLFLAAAPTAHGET
jgi:hypothetical protein